MNSNVHTVWRSQPPSPSPSPFPTYTVIGLQRKRVHSFTSFFSSISQESKEKWVKLFFYGLQDIILSIYWNIEGLDGKLSFLFSSFLFHFTENDYYYCYFYLLLHCHMPWWRWKKVFIKRSFLYTVKPPQNVYRDVFVLSVHSFRY